MDGSTNPAGPDGNSAGAEVNRGGESHESRNEALPPGESSATRDPVSHAADAVSGRPPRTPPPPVTPEDRIQELKEHALREANPLISAISTAGGDLLLMQRAIINVITEMIQTDPDRLGAIGDAAPHLNLALKAGSQGLQFFGFADRLHRQKGVPPPSE